MNPPTPPSLPPAMDPHQMNATPPATLHVPAGIPVYLAPGSSLGASAVSSDHSELCKEAEALAYAILAKAPLNAPVAIRILTDLRMALVARHAPTAPRPTTDVAGLVERLTHFRDNLATGQGCDKGAEALWVMLDDAISALTQLAPLAEGLAYWKDQWNKQTDRYDETQTELEAANDKLTAAKLDAEALAGAIESVLARPNYASGQAAKQALEQHRARGAAGVGK